jgi:hypothetical protein
MHIECALFSAPEMQSLSASKSPKYDGPPAPQVGQLYVDNSGSFWKVARITVAQNPVGFYLLHLCYGESLDDLKESMIVGPREFAALARERDLRSHLHSV